MKSLEKKIEKELGVAEKKLKDLSHQPFACKPDAIKAANKLLKKSRFHRLTEILTKPILRKDENGSESWYYQIEATVSLYSEKVAALKNQAGRFILATNVLDFEALNSENMLYTYKNQQQSVERCFAFLKDPMFFADSVFLKSPKRIEALGLIMALSLLVYQLAQRQIRKTLKRTGSGIKNQLGRLTDRPTWRWIFQCFQSIHIYIERGFKQISNINEERLHILKFFPPACQRYYLLA